LAGESRALAKFISELEFKHLPSKAVENAKLCILDTVAVAIAGSRVKAADMFFDVVASVGGRPEATILGRGVKVPCLSAALVNGAMAHMVEMDDVHKGAIIHPGAPIVPAALAIAEREGADGRALITAVVAGYDVAIRLGECVGKTHYQFWHTTGTCGTFGAAAAGCVVLGLDEERTLNALGNAGDQASGLWEFLKDGAMSKFLHTGKAAFDGLLATLLAQKGFTGAKKIIEGEAGFCEATSDDYDLSKITDGLGERFKITEISLKPYPSCRFTHAPIDAALAIRAERPIRPEEVEGIEVRTHAQAVRIAGNPRPRTPYEAKFSIAFCVAYALLHGEVGLGAFSEANLKDERLRALMEKVSVAVDPGIDAQFPAKWPAEVIVSLRDGSALKKLVEYPLGDPENPMSFGDVEKKLYDLARGVLSDEQMASAASLVRELEKLADVGELMELLA